MRFCSFFFKQEFESLDGSSSRWTWVPVAPRLHWKMRRCRHQSDRTIPRFIWRAIRVGNLPALPPYSKALNRFLHNVLKSHTISWDSKSSLTLYAWDDRTGSLVLSLCRPLQLILWLIYVRLASRVERKGRLITTGAECAFSTTEDVKCCRAGREQTAVITICCYAAR